MGLSLVLGALNGSLLQHRPCHAPSRMASMTCHVTPEGDGPEPPTPGDVTVDNALRHPRARRRTTIARISAIRIAYALTSAQRFRWRSRIRATSSRRRTDREAVRSAMAWGWPLAQSA